MKFSIILYKRKCLQIISNTFCQRSKLLYLHKQKISMHKAFCPALNKTIIAKKLLKSRRIWNEQEFYFFIPPPKGITIIIVKKCFPCNFSHRGFPNKNFSQTSLKIIKNDGIKKKKITSSQHGN